MRRIGGRTDDDKIVPGDLPARDAVALVDELLLGFGIVHQQQIGIAPPRGVERLAGSLRDHMDR